MFRRSETSSRKRLKEQTAFIIKQNNNIKIKINNEQNKNNQNKKQKKEIERDGNKQLKDGINYLITLRYLKQLFQNVDEINKLLTLKYYLNKWNDKANKLKKRS